MNAHIKEKISEGRGRIIAGVLGRTGALSSTFAICTCAAMLIISPEQSSASSESKIEENSAIPPSEYRLGQGDKIRLKVFAWRAAKAEIFSWTPLNAEFAVGVSGSVSLPLLGEVPAASLSTEDLSRTIAYRLQDRFGLVERPQISVEIAQYRPFYIVGRVQHPGEYAFRPGMTVLQALSLAGGEARSIETLRLRREVISSSGELDVLQSERNALIARKARLTAEMSSADSVTFPRSLTDEAGSDGQSVVEQERLVFRARKSAFEGQLNTLNELNSYLQKESTSAKAQLTTHEHEVSLVSQQLDAIKSLVEKRLAIDSRRVDMERNLMQVEGERLRLQSNVMRVAQEISRTQLSLMELRNNRSQEITADLAATEAKLDQVNRRIATTNKLLAESVSIAPSVSDLRPDNVGLRYQIIRVSNGGAASQLSATELTLVQPGDTIKVDHNDVQGIMASSSGDNSLALYAPSSSLRSLPPVTAAEDSAKAATAAAEAQLNNGH